MYDIQYIKLKVLKAQWNMMLTLEAAFLYILWNIKTCNTPNSDYQQI